MQGGISPRNSVEEIGRAQKQYTGEVDPLLDALCGSFVVEALAGELPESHSPAASIYRQQLLDFALSDGLIGSASPGESPQEAQDIWNGLISDYPDQFHITHAVGCVGYDDSRSAFIIRNSWGADWGEAGYGFMPYAYMLDPGLAADFWTVQSAPGGLPLRL